MAKLASAIEILKLQGLPGVLGAIRRNVYSRTSMLCLVRLWDGSRDAPGFEDGNLRVRLATPGDADAIAMAWPAEFSHLTGDLLLRDIRHRFTKGIPCFVVCEGEEVVGGGWSYPWSYEAVLPAELQGKGAYELTNVFTVPRVRGRGAAGLFILHAMAHMAQRGCEVACARILPERPASIAAFRKAGFESLGLLTSGTTLGRNYCRLEQVPSAE